MQKAWIVAVIVLGSCGATPRSFAQETQSTTAPGSGADFAIKKLLEQVGGQDQVSNASATGDPGGSAESNSSGPPTSKNDVAANSDAPEELPTIPLEKKNVPPSKIKDEPVSRKIEEIVVTATKREMSARDIPVSIDAKTGDQLEKMGARDLLDYIATVPGITLQDGTNGEAGGRKITIRGVGPSETNGISGNQTVGQFIGDIPMTDPYSNYMTPDLDPFDLQTVEILKGPQGTYFGASALNGAIRYVPAKPQIGEWALRGFAEGLSIAEGGYGSTYAAALNAPIGESLAVRATGVLQDTPGYIDNLQRHQKDADSRSKWSGRGSLRWQPSDKADINLMYLKQVSKKNDILDVDNTNQQLTNNSRPGPSSIKTGFDLASVDARYDLEEWGTVVWESALQKKSVLSQLDDTMFTGSQGIQNFRAYATTAINGTTHELRLVSPGDGDWTWILGAFYLNDEARIHNDAFLPGTALPVPSLPVVGQVFGPFGLSLGIIETDTQARETSLYGELTRRFWSDWELTVGARLYKTRISGTYVAEGLLGVASPDVDIDLRDHGVSPKVSLSYKPTADLMAYLTFSRGFQFGGVNIVTSGLPFDNPLTGPPVPTTFGSSILWNREVGIRMDWLDGILRTDVAVYDLDWSRAQFVEVNDNLVLDTDYVSNVGKVRSQGVETSLTYLPPIDGLTLNVAVGYSNARTAASYTAKNGTVIPPGTSMPNSPKYQTATTLSYSSLFGPWLVGGSVTHTLTSRAYDTITHDHEIFGYQAASLGLNLARPDWSGAPSLSFGVTNLTDVRGVIGRSTSAGVSGVTGSEAPSYIFIRPRTLTLRLSFDFK